LTIDLFCDIYGKNQLESAGEENCKQLFSKATVRNTALMQYRFHADHFAKRWLKVLLGKKKCNTHQRIQWLKKHCKAS